MPVVATFLRRVDAVQHQRFTAALPALASGLLTAAIAFTSSFSVIVQGLHGVGATVDQAASGLFALSVTMGLCSILYSWASRMPISIAWSTPGAAFLAIAGTPSAGYPAAIGAFVATGLLILVAGLIKPFGRLITKVPRSLANAMLAGILFDLCMAPVRAAAAVPLDAGLIIATFLLVGAVKRLAAVPAAALVTMALILFRAGDAVPGLASLTGPVAVMPQFDLSAIIGIGLPLFVITMASQNVPGLAILKLNGYEPAPGPIFVGTGLATALAAPFGALAFNLAAITAALCAGPEAGPDKRLRYLAGISSGAAYILFGLAAGWIVTFAAQAPLLIGTIAGLALLGALASSLHGAMEVVKEREAAAVCFLVSASGLAFMGVSAAFWGLVSGAGVLGLRRLAGSDQRRAA